MACKKHSFRALLVPGHVAGLITDGVRAAQIGEAAVVSRNVDFVGASGFGRKRFRLNRKTPAHLVGHCVHARPRVWKRLHFLGSLVFSGVDCKRRRCNRHGDETVLFFPGLVWVDFGMVQAHVSRSAC